MKEEMDCNKLEMMQKSCNKLWMEVNYVGACSLLSKISFKLSPTDEFQELIQTALEDLTECLEDGKKRFTVVRTNYGTKLDLKEG